MGLGLAAQRDVLVYAGNLGNEPRRPAHGNYLLADSHHGGSGRLDAVKRGKRDIGTQMLELVAWGYDDPAKAEAAAIEQLRQIIKPG